MKSKETRYEEAVTRNLYAAKRSGYVRFPGKSIDEVKHHLGIRLNDKRYDLDLFNLVD